MSPVSCHMSHISCLTSPVSCLMSTVSTFEAKLFFIAKLPKRNTFLAKRSETYEAKRSETKRNFWFVVSRNWSETKRNRFCFAKFRFEAKHFLKRNWDTLIPGHLANHFVTISGLVRALPYHTRHTIFIRGRSFSLKSSVSVSLTPGYPPP